MFARFASLDPTVQAMPAGFFTWSIAAIGAAVVFWTSQIHRKLLDAMLGFSGGVMLAASYWSLLAPAIEISEHGPLPAWLPPLSGFLLGGSVLWLFDRLVPHLHLGFPLEKAEGPKTSMRRTVLLVTAITLHNIPEGLAVGVAFGGIIAGSHSTASYDVGVILDGETECPPRYLPTLEQIREACLLIQAEWSDAERERRAVFKRSQELDYGRPVRVGE